MSTDSREQDAMPDDGQDSDSQTFRLLMKHGEALSHIIALEDRIAALEKCIEARDAALNKPYGVYVHKCELPCCKPYRDAIRRADEGAGR